MEQRLLVLVQLKIIMCTECKPLVGVPDPLADVSTRFGFVTTCGFHKAAELAVFA